MKPCIVSTLFLPASLHAARPCFRFNAVSPLRWCANKRGAAARASVRFPASPGELPGGERGQSPRERQHDATLHESPAERQSA